MEPLAKPCIDSRIGELKAILYLLQSHLEGFKAEVDNGYELLKIGEKTGLAKEIEETIDDPLGRIFGISTEIEAQAKSIIDRIVQGFLKSKSNSIETAFRTKTSMNDLHYCIVLKDDTMENRAEIFDFYDRYDLLDISARYPVDFQFVPANLIGKIETIAPIAL